MNRRLRAPVTVGFTLAAVLACPAVLFGQVKVLMSGGFSAAFEELLPEFTKSTGITVTTARGPSQGEGPNTIGAQLRRGVSADVVIMSREGLDELIAEGRIVTKTDADLGQAPLGMSVRAGASKPDISTVDAFKQTLLRAKSITFPNSTTGIYMMTKMFPRLGIASAISRKITYTGVAAVARGESEIAIQPVSELLHAPGVDFVGTIPAEIQYISVFSAALVAGSKEPEAAKRLIAFLTSESAKPAIQKTGMEPSKSRWSPALTPDGHPDLQGNWLNRSATPLERPKELEGRPFLTDAEVAELRRRADRLFKSGQNDYAAGDNLFLGVLANPERFKSPTSTSNSDDMVEREFDNRTSLVVDPPDGRIPSYTPEGQRRQAAAAAANVARNFPAGPKDLTPSQRCITFGVPRVGGVFSAGQYGYFQIFQSPGYVVIFFEAINDTRIIPLDGRPHLPQNMRTWDGDSRGRWEGNTLVVDTANFSAQSSFMGSAENLHLVERFTIVAPDEIRYEIAIDDPTTWTKPWAAMIRLKRTEEKLYEFACHEGNAETEAGILLGAHAAEKSAAENAGREHR